MGYGLIGNGDYNNPVKTILENRGITKDLFNLDESVIEDYNNYDNMIEGVQLLLKHLDEDNEILIVVDSDNDGLNSFAMLYNYIKEIYPLSKITYKQHTGKQHGLSDMVIGEHVDLVIVPDAGTQDYEEHKKLKELNVDVLVIDHHKAEEYSKDALVINNQLSKNVKNKELSGAGVCYKFLTALDDYLGECLANNFIDLCAVGNIGDMMDLHSIETRHYVYEGLRKTNNLFLQALKEEKSYDLDNKYNISKVGWTICPILNGTIRNGTIKEKADMVAAFISDDYDFCLKVAKSCKNAKARQDNAVKKAMKDFEDIEIVEGQKVLVINSPSLNSNYSGLVANKLLKKYGLNVLMCKDKIDGKVGGSFRGLPTMSDNFYKDIEESGIASVLGGHDFAGGWECKKEDLKKFLDYLNNLYKDKEVVTESNYAVDFILDATELEQWIIDDIAALEDEWGNGIDKPLLAIQNVELELTSDNVKATNIIFDVNGIKFIKKYATKILKELLIDEYIECDIIGTCTINSFDGVGQIEIEDIIIN